MATKIIIKSTDGVVISSKSFEEALIRLLYKVKTEELQIMSSEMTIEKDITTSSVNLASKEDFKI